MSLLEFNFAARSDVGVHRELNEDSGLASKNLLVVADGLGGHAAGELASSTAIALVNELDLSNSNSEKLHARLTKVTSEISKRLLEQSTRHSERSGLGTTLSLIGLRPDGMAFVFHIGDSRVYFARDGLFERLTTDHTYVQKLIDEGDLTETEAASHPQRALLTQAIDGITPADGDFQVKEVMPGDKFLVCTDGLNAVVKDKEIEQALSNLEPAAAVTSLVDLALDRGAPDNVTVIVGDVRQQDTALKAEPIVVGAAAMVGNRANLSQLRFPTDQMPTPSATEQSAPPSTPLTPASRAPLRAIILTSLPTFGFAVLGVYAALISTQIFVGVNKGRVTIYQGIPQNIAFLQLHRPLETTDLEISMLPLFERQQVVGGISVESNQSAKELIEQLRLRSSGN